MFPRPSSFPRPRVRAAACLLLALAFVFAAQHSARAVGTFVSAPSRVDMVYDSARDTLYITSGGSVLRYKLSTNSFLAPFSLGGDLAGLDLSPDGNTLVVADRTHDASNLWVHVVDLRTGAATKAVTALDYMEGGTFTVAFGSDNQVLVTSRFEGSGFTPLRRLNPATGEWTKLNSLLLDSNGELSQDAMLAASGDRSVIGFAEANISDGRWGSYKVSDSTLTHRTYAFGTGWFNYEIGVNKNGTQYAIPTFGGTIIYNASFAQVATVGTQGGARPSGVVYHPVEDLVYFPFTTTTQVRAFNTNTFAQVAAYDFQDTFQSSGNFAFQQGRMKMSRDGSLLFCTVTGGVRFLRLYAPLAASNKSVTTQANRPAGVTLSGTVGNGGALSYRVETQPAHGTLTGTAPNLVYTPETNYEGADSFTFRSLYGPAESAPATVNITVTPANQAPTVNDQSVTVDEEGSITVTVIATDPDSTLLMYTIGDRPAHGTVTFSSQPNGYVYTPAHDYYGPDSFTINVTDGTGSTGSGVTVTGHVYITVNNVNDAPTATNQSLATDEDTPLSITLPATDVDGDALSFTVFAPPQHGTLTGTAPNLVYTPAADYNGPDGFGFKATDGTAYSNDATVSINVRAVNDAPLGVSMPLATLEDTPASFTVMGFDPDGDPLSYEVLTQPAHGTLTGTAPNLTYTPSPNFNGVDGFTFRVSDGKAQSQAATVSFSVAAVNDAPYVFSSSVTTAEDTPVTVMLSAYDPDGSGQIDVQLVSPPQHGTLTAIPSGIYPVVTYTPAPNYNGPDSFSFKASDGQLESSVAVFSINVTPVNDSPVANNLTITTDEDTPVPVTLSGTDPDGDPVSIYLASVTTHGGLGGTSPNYTYYPTPDYNGTDTLTYRVSDGTSVVTATVTIIINPVEDAPRAYRQNLTGTEDTALPVTLNGSDPDGDALSYAVTAGPRHGTLSGTAPNLVYTPAPDFYGYDDFAFSVSDGKSTPGAERVYITVNGVNDAPTAAPQSVTTNEDSAKLIFLNGSDPDANPLTYTVVSGPSHGTLSGSGFQLTYTPAANYNGPDGFTFKVNDGTVDSNEATVDINVNSVNDAPVSSSLTIATGEDTPAAVVLSATDTEGDAVSYTVATQPQHGTLSGTAPNLVYTPAANYSGPDSFTYVASDPQAQGPAATVSINVASVNDAPVANSQSVALAEDSTATVVLSGSDVEGDALSYAVVTGPAHGTLTGTAPNLVYTPAADYNGPDGFTFRTSDGQLSSAVATVSLNVNAVNDAPVANPQTLAGVEDAAKALTLTGSDVDGDALTYMLITAPQHGSLTGTVPNLVYTPAANYNGPDSFTFVVYDGQAQSQTATVNVNVASVNDAPTAVADTASVVRNSSANNIAVLSNDGDVDGDALTITSVTKPANGTTSVAPGGKSVTYTPNKNYRGTEVFTYTVGDGRGGTATANVTVTVK
ncbi:MAG TPA: Ig-like domain-containing protein [Pyrinomonadaceae bacterium]|nr:Ig-like domain-containing protein [Pyrinomonadaceae bacterium]